MNVTIHGESYQVHWPRTVVPVYLRYGLFSNRERSRNHATGEREAGISVYPAILTAGGGVRIADGWELCDSLAERLCFPVTGREVGTGSDGEPVLRGVRMLPYPIDLSANVSKQRRGEAL